MALDGISVSALVYELDNTLKNGRIIKIAQPEKDELLLTIKNNGTQYRLLISAGASLPLMYLTSGNKPSPLNAPNFCMLLRKHINNAKILGIVQPGLERVIHFELEHLNDLGDLCKKFLTVELMGRHSNIIFRNEEHMIIDSIKHVSAQISSVREVLPGRPYFIPKTTDKYDPLTLTWESYLLIALKPLDCAKALYTSLTGLSPAFAEEICERASIDSSFPINTLNSAERKHLFTILASSMEEIKNKHYDPCIYYENNMPRDFSAVPYTIYGNLETKHFASISNVLETFYSEKNSLTRIRQKTADLRQVIQIALNKNYKKADLQIKQLKDTEKKEKFKVYGELIIAYGYQLEPGAKELKAVNFYTGEEVTIPLDGELTPIENAKKYFDKYGKLKRTHEALIQVVEDTKEEISHLESINTALDISGEESDIAELKEELMQFGYIKRKNTGKQSKITSKPLHYISSDGYHMYVGKNNFQNEYLTFKLADGGDWWFHAKKLPGSHVIVKNDGEPLPDSTFEEAGKLAAYYSKGREQEKVEVDYTKRKNIKKPGGGKPGFVIYHTNYSLVAQPDITGIKKI